MNTIFPINFSHTMMSDLWSCEFKWYRTHCQRLSGVHRSGDLIAGGLFSQKKAQALLNTEPLEKLIKTFLPFENIQKNIQNDLIEALALTAVRYATGASHTFVHSKKPLSWRRTRRVGLPAKISPAHVLASSAIPILFPPVSITGTFFGDGSLRNYTPLSPAIKCGAEKILIIANKLDTSQEMANKIRSFIGQWPDWVGIDFAPEKNSQKHYKLTNGCEVKAVATSKDALRGFTPTVLVFDEAAFIEADADFFFGDVDAGFDGHHPAGFDGLGGVADVVDIPIALEQIQNVLTHTHRGIMDVRFETREDLLQRFEETRRSYVVSLGGVAVIGLIVGAVIAALIVGSSIVMTVEGGPTLMGLPAFGFLGFCGAVVGLGGGGTTSLL